MCGIFGAIGDKSRVIDVGLVLGTLKHRGPDDCGSRALALGDHSRLVLGSTRLAILDLSPAGHMPMHDSTTDNWIVYNGEIYNYVALRDELESLGECFASDTDTEVVLKAYGRWGTDCLTRFDGMFALAIWDQRAGTLFLARDRLGEKPLYYAAARNQLVFASELRTILASSLVEPQLDPAAVECFLCNGFVVSPLTMIRGVRGLLPAHWMTVRRDGTIRQVGRYWRVPSESTETPPLAGAEAVRQSLEDSVNARLAADVPLGAFLSGGLDSSAVVALMSRHVASVHTVSIQFDDPSFDESRYARQVANSFATQHASLRVGADEFEAWVDAAIQGMDQPTFDGVNSYFVSRAARESGLTVALSGVGADELFGGYPFFRSVPRLARLRAGIPEIVRSAPKRIAALSPGLDFRVSGPLKAADLFAGAAIPGLPGLDSIAAYQVAASLFPARARRRLFPAFSGEVDKRLWMGLPLEFVEAVSHEIGDDSGAAATSKLALRLFLGERCLRDADSMSMAVSLEVRTPFTSHAFLERALAVPADIRTRNAPNKTFEQEVVAPLLGGAFQPREKQGFIFPLERWLREGRTRERAMTVLTDPATSDRLGLAADGLRAFGNAFFAPRSAIPWSRAWALFVLSVWCDRHGVRPA